MMPSHPGKGLEAQQGWTDPPLPQVDGVEGSHESCPWKHWRGWKTKMTVKESLF